jgi:tight adherence protein C
MLEAIVGFVPPDMMVTVISALMFVAVAGLTLAVFAGATSRRELRERLAGPSGAARAAAAGASHAEEVRVARRLVEQAARKVLPSNETNLKLLRQNLIRAGIFDANAVGLYFLARLLLAGGLCVAAFFLAPALFPDRQASFHWLITLGAAALGYYLPSIYLRRRINRRVSEHRDGFPDFLDLLVVCADAGLSTEAAIDRVARELMHAYPSLSTNLSISAIEIRAGSATTIAFDHLAERLGLAEARSFATLLQQSEEYGSSLTDSLRIYSDDMRHARMTRAEEKANSLPARMTLPLMLFIFPVILVVVMLPVVARFMESGLTGG